MKGSSYEVASINLSKILFKCPYQFLVPESSVLGRQVSALSLFLGGPVFPGLGLIIPL